jgi:hypothetical protein
MDSPSDCSPVRCLGDGWREDLPLVALGSRGNKYSHIKVYILMSGEETFLTKPLQSIKEVRDMRCEGLLFPSQMPFFFSFFFLFF